MKKFSHLLIFTIIVISGVLTIFLTFHFANSYSAGKETKCPPSGKLHNVVIKDGNVTPVRTEAKLCESLRIVNFDRQTRLIAFGEHDTHKSYDGVSEKFLKTGEWLQVDLNKTGQYIFHDHLDDKIQGDFTVSQ